MPLHCLLCSADSGPAGGTRELAALGIAREVPDPEMSGLTRGLPPLVEFALGIAARRADGVHAPDTVDFPGIGGVVTMQDGEKERATPDWEHTAL